tara:strand:- start:41695 stop:44343 length:2649 start_codon:yes stop_codon:yes gene_type:complete
MTKRMLIDATHKEELRVAITDGNRLVEYDYESQNRKPLKGSIFLAKVTRVEPSLQAAFVNFGGNRHGFLPFSEIHPDYFRIPVSDREALMAEQEALIKEHDEEEALDDDDIEGSGDDDDAETDEDSDGDDQDDTADDASDNADDDNAGNKVNEETDAGDDNTGNTIEEPNEPNGNVALDADQNNDQNKKGGRRRNNQKGRGGRGGRGRRSQYKNPNVEVVGGEEIDQEQRFRFNLRRKYKIQEVIKRGQIMLVQANKEERGNKGAAVGSYLSLPGRYCVLMPNSPRGGGVSRKIANHKDRARMRDIVKSLEVPKGMSVIVRTAGVTRTKAEIKRDLDYLMRLWDNIRELTLESTAPAAVYEEADLIKRSVRDLYTRDVEEILVAGEEGYKIAREFMKMMIPSHVKKVVKYEDGQLPLFNRYQIESQINEIGQPEVRLKSGGYLVINPTEALISIDVNSGKSTKGRHIEETAVKTNLEAADEVARQLKLRDLGGLVVIDFIDMEDRRNNSKVERRVKEALSTDRARVQVGRISSFGLMELSRQRLSPSLTEAQYEKCKVCSGIGIVPTSDAMSIMVLRAIEEEGIRARAAQIIVQVTNDVALFILNYKRTKLAEIEQRYGLEVLLRVDDTIPASEYRIEVSKPVEQDEDGEQGDQKSNDSQPQTAQNNDKNDKRDDQSDSDKPRKRGRRGGRGRGRSRSTNAGDADQGQNQNENQNQNQNQDQAAASAQDTPPSEDGEGKKRNNRRPAKPKDAPKPSDSSDAPSPEAQDVSADKGDKKGAKAANDSADKSDAPKPKAQPKKSTAKAKKDAEPKDAPAKDAVKKEAKADGKPAKKPAKKDDEAKAKKKPAKAVNDQEPSPASQYEVVNQAPKEKKKGWWNRLVE